jgi:uncharacterized protein YecE (DUF72 family)
MSVYIGTSGFSYPDWKGIVYPPDLKKRYGHELPYYAQFFDCCEINVSFYRPLQEKVANNWCKMVAEVNPEFLFTAKLFRGFTHAPTGTKAPRPFELSVSPEEEKQTRQGFDALAAENRLGAVLMQFPISFKNEDDTRDYLFSLIKKFSQYPLVLEIRHQSWNDPDILSRLAEQGVGFCNIDQPHLGKSIRATQHVTALTGYVRLHGRNYQEWFQAKNRNDRYNYLYKPEELEGWKEKIENIRKQSKNTFTLTNNHYKGQAAVNAIELKNMLSGKKVKAPKPLVDAYPQELSDIAETV